MKYKIKIGTNEYIMPKENIRGLALIKAIDLKVTGIPLDNEEQAVKFLESLGMEISEVA